MAFAAFKPGGAAGADRWRDVQGQKVGGTIGVHPEYSIYFLSFTKAGVTQSFPADFLSSSLANNGPSAQLGAHGTYVTRRFLNFDNRGGGFPKFA